MKIIFLGPQGSGKSTQAKKIARELNVPYIEMGGLLRDKMNDIGRDAKDIKAALKSGNLVTNEITIRTLNQRVQKADCQNGFVLDGYPRNQEQLDNLPKGIEKVIYINVSNEEAISRLKKRARDDDTKEVIQKRLDIYHQQTEPLLDYFRKKGILVEVDGIPSIEEVNKDIKKRLQNEAN